MLKRFLMLLVCIPFALAAFSAQLTATLQSGDSIKPFYGSSAFVDAFNAAVAGDIITLSPGSFTSTEINKGVTVTGTYAFDEKTSTSTQFSSMTVSADNVTIEGVRFTYSLTVKGADQLTLTRCYITTFTDAEKEDHKYHDNTILTDCFVGDFQAMELSKNAVLRNCCINYFSKSNESSYLALIENCNIPKFKEYWWSSSGGYKYFYTVPYAVYRNCYLRFYSNNAAYASYVFTSPSEFHNNHIEYAYQNGSGSSKEWELNFDSVVWEGNVYANYYSIEENAENGKFTTHTKDDVNYGVIDHKTYPAIPSIQSAEIDTETDADGILHVKINAVAND